jgi:hypothetical protein
VDASGFGINNVDAARVGPGGVLEPWIAVDASPSYSGYGFAAAANQLFVFGGHQGEPSTNAVSAQICGLGLTCNGGASDPPDLKNWNSLGLSLVVPRHLPGSAVDAAHIYLVGGATLGGSPTETVETSIW